MYACMDEQCYVNVFPDRQKDTLLAGRELYGHMVQLVGCTTTEMIPTIEMISATEMTPNHHRNDTYSQSKWSRHKFSEPWLKWTWDFAIYSKFFVYSCKHDSKQRKIEKAIRLITVL